MTVRDLRDVLREHGDAAPPPNPARHEQVRARIGRIRRRRRLLATGTAAAAVAAVLGVVVLPGGPGQRGDTTVAVDSAATPAGDTPTPKLPETFTAPDGTVYRRLAMTSIGATGSRKATVTIPVTGKPLDVAGVCTPRGEAPSGIQIRIDGRPTTNGGLICARGRQPQRRLEPLTVPAGLGRATITFDTTTHGSTCGRPDPKNPCRPVTPERVPWDLAVYEWTPPQQPVQPAAPKAFPRTSAGWKLADTGTGTWPGRTSLKFRVRGDGGQIGLDAVCTGDLGARLWFRYEIDGKDTGAAGGCAVWEKGPYPMAMTLFKSRKGKPMTITVKPFVESSVEGRPIRWSVGLFRR